MRDDFWTTAFWTFVGQAVFGAVVLALPGPRRQFLRLLRANTVALLSINGINELVNLAGGLGARYALMLAPLSIVQAITSTTTLFVFLFGVAISLAIPRARAGGPVRAAAREKGAVRGFDCHRRHHGGRLAGWRGLMTPPSAAGLRSSPPIPRREATPELSLVESASIAPIYYRVPPHDCPSGAGVPGESHESCGRARP